jgi:hypothetical protein
LIHFSSFWVLLLRRLRFQGWSPFILDTNGNGKRDDYVEPNQPIDPAKDKRIVPGSGPYGVMPSPVDGSMGDTCLALPGAPVGL